MQFNQYHVIHSQTGKKAILSTKFLYLILTALVILVFYVTADNFETFLFKAAAMAIVAAIGIIFTKKLILGSVKRQIKNLKKSGRLPYSTSSIVIFEAEDIQEITQTSESKTSYCLVEKIILANNAVYIYFSVAQAFIIPDRYFETMQEKQSLLQLLKQKTNLDAQPV